MSVRVPQYSPGSAGLIVGLVTGSLMVVAVDVVYVGQLDPVSVTTITCPSLRVCEQ